MVQSADRHDTSLTRTPISPGLRLRAPNARTK
jgi:hypothetical protein